MSREMDRRWITMSLLVLLASVAWKGGNASQTALALSPVAALLARCLAFYFPTNRRLQKNTPGRRRSGLKRA